MRRLRALRNQKDTRRHFPAPKTNASQCVFPEKAPGGQLVTARLLAITNEHFRATMRFFSGPKTQTRACGFQPACMRLRAFAFSPE
jgi:hypothetical protein